MGVVWCGVVWCGVVWCGVVWCGVVWGGVVWCGVVWCGVVWCGVVWCGAVWCGVVWCGVVWCGVVWCAYQKAMAGMVLHAGKCKPKGLCVYVCAVCSVFAPGALGQKVPLLVAVSVQGRPGDALPFRLLVQLKFSQHPHHHASWA